MIQLYFLYHFFIYIVLILHPHNSSILMRIFTGSLVIQILIYSFPLFTDGLKQNKSHKSRIPNACQNVRLGTSNKSGIKPFHNNMPKKVIKNSTPTAINKISPIPFIYYLQAPRFCLRSVALSIVRRCIDVTSLRRPDFLINWLKLIGS